MDKPATPQRTASRDISGILIPEQSLAPLAVLFTVILAAALLVWLAVVQPQLDWLSGRLTEEHAALTSERFEAELGSDRDQLQERLAALAQQLVNERRGIRGVELRLDHERWPKNLSGLRLMAGVECTGCQVLSRPLPGSQGGAPTAWLRLWVEDRDGSGLGWLVSAFAVALTGALSAVAMLVMRMSWRRQVRRVIEQLPLPLLVVDEAHGGIIYRNRRASADRGFVEYLGRHCQRLQDGQWIELERSGGERWLALATRVRLGLRPAWLVIVGRPPVEDMEEQAASRALSAIDHGLRQPIQALTVLLSRIRGTEEGSGAPRPPGVVQAMEHALARARDELDALTVLRGGDTGAAGLPTLVELEALLERLDHDARPLARQQGTILRFHYPDLEVSVDPEQAIQLLRGLVLATLRSGGARAVFVTARLRRHRALLQVWCSGGEPPAALDGFLLDADESGHDPRFHRGPDGWMAGLHLPTLLGLDSLVVAVLDDDVDVRSALENLLSRRVARVGCHARGGSLLAAIREGFRPGLVVVDSVLEGGEDGLAVLRQVRETLGYAVPAVVVSGVLPTPVRLPERSAFLLKPVDADALWAMVAVVLARAVSGPGSAPRPR